MKSRNMFLITLGTLISGAMALSVQNQMSLDSKQNFGILPSNALHTYEMTQVQGEIGVWHIIDPRLVTGKIPKGFNPQTVSAAVKNNSSDAAWLSANKQYSNYYLGVLSFPLIGSMSVDGSSLGPCEPVRNAFWWILGGTTAPLDKLAKGSTVLQLAIWYPRSSRHCEEMLLATYSKAKFETVEINRDGTDRWRVHLKTPEVDITGVCRAVGLKRVMNDTLPAFTTQFSAEDPKIYTLFTYFGSHEQDMEAVWNIRGGGSLVSSLTDSKATPIFRTIIQDGWSARAGLYEIK